MCVWEEREEEGLREAQKLAGGPKGVWEEPEGWREGSVSKCLQGAQRLNLGGPPHVEILLAPPTLRTLTCGSCCKSSVFLFDGARDLVAVEPPTSSLGCRDTRGRNNPSRQLACGQRKCQRFCNECRREANQ